MQCGFVIPDYDPDCGVQNISLQELFGVHFSVNDVKKLSPTIFQIKWTAFEVGENSRMID